MQKGSQLKKDLKKNIVPVFKDWQKNIFDKLSPDVSIKKTEAESSVINLVNEKESCCKVYEKYPSGNIIDMIACIKDYETQRHLGERYNNDNYFNNNDEGNTLRETSMDTILMIDYILSNVQENQMRLYDNQYKRKTVLLTSQITIDLWLIYLILRKFPFAITSHDQRERYLKHLLPYKNWPDPVGSIGYLIYTLLVNDLYLPGITLIQDIRRIYMIDIIDPKKFLLNQNHFCSYYSYGYKCHDILKAKADNEQIIKPMVLNKKIQDKNEHQNNKLRITDFASLTIVHLLIFFGEMFHSYESSPSEEILMNIYDYFSRAIPDCKHNQKIEYNLLTKNSLEIKRNHKDIVSINEKNITRNTSNKNLLISFFNIIDGGIKMNYHENFIPIITEIIERLSIIKMSPSETTDKKCLMNLNKYYLPKIYMIKDGDDENNQGKSHRQGFGKGYDGGGGDSEDIYLICEKQIEVYEHYYLSHLEKVKLEEFHFTPEQLAKVTRFNENVYLKRSLFHTYFRMNIIVEEREFHGVINTIYYDILNMNKSNKNNKGKKTDELQLSLSPKLFLDSITIYLMPSNSLTDNPNSLANYLRHKDIIYNIIHLDVKTEIQPKDKAKPNYKSDSKIKPKLDMNSKLHLLYFTEAKHVFNMQVYGIKNDITNESQVFYSTISFEAERNKLFIEVNDNNDEMKTAYNTITSTNTVEKKQSFKIINLNSTYPYGKVNQLTNCIDLLIFDDIDNSTMDKKDKKELSAYAHGYDLYQVNKLSIKNISGTPIGIIIDDNPDNTIIWNPKEKLIISPMIFSEMNNETIDEPFDYKVKIATFCNLHSDQ